MAIIATSLYSFSDPSTYLYALEQERAKEEHIRDVAKKLGVDPEFLLHPEGKKSFSLQAALSWAEGKLGLGTDVKSDAQPIDVRDSIAQVKEHYGLVTADSAVGKLAALLKLAAAPAATKAKKHGGIKGELQSALRLFDKDFLPPLHEGLPPVAQSRDKEMNAAIKQIRQQLQSVTGNPHALDDANLDATLSQLASSLSGTLRVKASRPRWTRDPFPVKDTYRTAPKAPALPVYGTSASTTSSVVATATTPRAVAPQLAVAHNTAGEITSLANTLQTPAKIFTWVHDTIQWDSYSGVAKGSLGTLKEGSGNDWDQALLLRDLLAARGYQAQIEWGKVTLPVQRAMNLVGTEDPLQAANLLATAGFDGSIVMNGSQPVAIRMTHAWVRAFIPFLPNRGVTNATPDTWVRMDPSFKRYNYQPGIALGAAWSEDEYLQNAPVQSPVDYYSDKLWHFIRTNGLDCKNLAQVPKTGTVRAEKFPYVPSTVTAHIDQPLGLDVNPPAEQSQRVRLAITDGNNAAVATYGFNLADAWGKKVAITFAPATPDDAAIIASYHGLFNTPAYLVHLKPVLSIDDAAVAEGSAVAAGAALDLGVSFDQPNVASDTVHHEVVAGETHTLILDAGHVPDALVSARADRLKTPLDLNAALSEKLFLIGLRYMQHVDDGVRFASGVRWHRAVKRVFEADVRQQIDVAYSVAGTPLRLTPAENNIDVSRLLVGVVPIGSDISKRGEVLSLAGIESSYREGAIWEEMESQQGISAAKALLVARINGQQLYTVNAGNVDAVLATANLSDDVEEEIRGAVAQGRIAKLAPNPISVSRWSGTGYILEDPTSGAATYPISGGLAGGSDTGGATGGVDELLGSESWLSNSPLGDLLRELLSLLGGGDGGGDDTPSTTQSDPVNLSSGNMFRTATDLIVVARGIPIALTRTYNSRSVYNGPFGYGWTFSYGEMLIPNGDGSITYREADGTEHLFAASGDGFVSPPGKHLTLASSGSGWTLRFKDGMQFTFDARGLLVAQTDLNSNSITINRDAAGNVSSVADASSRIVLTFTYGGGKITRVEDLAHRAVTYTYSGDNLTAVTDTAGKTWAMDYDLAHNMTGYTDPLGNKQSYDYDADDRLMRHTDATGAEEYFEYDIAARQSVLTDSRGGDRLVVFDDSGRATMEADPAGNVVKASFDADNNRTETIDSRGHSTAYEFDASGNVTKQTTPDGGVAQTTYDSSSRPLTTIDAIGTTTTNSYDASGNLLTSSRTVGGVTETTTNTYDSHGQLLSTADANNNTSSITWNDNGTMATRTDAANNTTTFITDPLLGRITAIKDPGNNTTSLEYDAKDRIASMTDPYGNSTSFAYDDAGRRLSVTTPRGTTKYTYDAEGRVLTVEDPLGNKSKTTYTLAGDVAIRSDARGNTTRYEYDAVGRVTKMTDANGGVWSYGYCGSLGGGGGGGSFCDLTDPNGRTIHQEFDVMGRVISVTDSLNHISYTQYDKAGRKTLETDANGNATKFDYDESGRLTRVTEASGAVTNYTYDKNGNKLTQKDANNHVWSFQYDALNRLLKETDPLTHVTSYTYDALGNLKTKTDAKNQTTTYGYAIRRLTSVTYANGATDTFTYDNLGRRTQAANGSITLNYKYDSLNRVINIENPNRWSIDYAYDSAGNLTSRSLRADGLYFVTGGTRVATSAYAYDAKNRLISINDNVTGMFRLAYDAMDRRTSLQYPNGVTTSYAYDNAYRLTALATKSVKGELLDAWSYQYDAVGNRTAKTDAQGHMETYAYDSVYRLTDVHYADGSREAFTYDAVGNRLTRLDQNSTQMLYSYDVANQLLTAGSDAFTYDANGSVTRKQTAAGTTNITYDAANRAVSVAAPDGTETSQYAPDGSRAYINGSGSASNWSNTFPIYDRGNPIADGANGSGINYYRTYGPGIDEPLAECAVWNGSHPTQYLHHDALGSVTLTTDVTGVAAYQYTYKAFGQSTTTPLNTSRTAGATRLGYTSRENSVGGLMQYRSRYYDPGEGRFAQQDAYEGQAASPPSLNRYIYVFDNAVRYTDPTGYSPEGDGVPAEDVLEVFIEMALTLGVLFAVAGVISHAAGDRFELGHLLFIVLLGFASAWKYIEFENGHFKSHDLSTYGAAFFVAFAMVARVVLTWVAGFIGFGLLTFMRLRAKKLGTQGAYEAAFMAQLCYAVAVAGVFALIDGALLGNGKKKGWVERTFGISSDDNAPPPERGGYGYTYAFPDPK